MQVIIRVDANRRIIVHQEGGYDLEAYVPHIGWVLDNEAEVSDAVIEGHFLTALAVIRRAGRLDSAV